MKRAANTARPASGSAAPGRAAHGQTVVFNPAYAGAGSEPEKRSVTLFGCSGSSDRWGGLEMGSSGLAVISHSGYEIRVERDCDSSVLRRLLAALES
jgi:hypothetical protein